MVSGLKEDIRQFSEVVDPRFSHFPPQSLASILKITPRHLRRLTKCLRDAQVSKFDFEPYQTHYSRQSAEIIWELHQRTQLDGFKKAFFYICEVFDGE